LLASAFLLVYVVTGDRDYWNSCTQGCGCQQEESPSVDGGETHPHSSPQDNRQVLKKLREIKLGVHMDHVYSISIDRLGEKYYLMIVIDGIDFVWV